MKKLERDMMERKKMPRRECPRNTSKHWLLHTSASRYALVLNPTNRNRYPPAIMTGHDSATFKDLAVVHGELPDQRFGRYLKNIGPHYVRGIVEGNGTPPAAAKAFYLAGKPRSSPSIRSSRGGHLQATAAVTGSAPPGRTPWSKSARDRCKWRYPRSR